MGKKIKTKFTPLLFSAVEKQPPVLEKKNRPCKFADKCKRQDCIFIHPGEVFQRKKTKMCKFLNNCSRGINCPFAHHQSEIHIPECRYGAKCKKDGCTFSHPEEIKQEPITPKQPTVFEFHAENFPSVTNDILPQFSSNLDFISTLQSTNQYQTFSKNCVVEGTVDEMMNVFNLVTDIDTFSFTFTT